MSVKTFQAVLVQDRGSVACGIELPFDPKAIYGKVRAPVRVTINNHCFRTTVAAMGGSYWIPINKANREGAGLTAAERLTVRIESDSAPRAVTPPPELAKAMASRRSLQTAWDRLSYTRQKECAWSVAEAKKPETRQRRVARILHELKNSK